MREYRVANQHGFAQESPIRAKIRHTCETAIICLVCVHLLNPIALATPVVGSSYSYLGVIAIGMVHIFLFATVRLGSFFVKSFENEHSQVARCSMSLKNRI